MSDVVQLVLLYEGLGVEVRIALAVDDVGRVFQELDDGDLMADFVSGTDADGDAFLISRHGLRAALVNAVIE